MISATLRVARIALRIRCSRPRLKHRSIAGVRRSITGEPGHQDAESANEAPDCNPAGPGGEAQAEGCREHDDERISNTEPAKHGWHPGSTRSEERRVGRERTER